MRLPWEQPDGFSVPLVNKRATNSERKSMTIENPKVDPLPMSNTEKDPDDWVSGDEPMTGAQASYLKTLSEQLGEPHEFNQSLTKAEASKRIDVLKSRLEAAREKR
jgi:Protein of unknown function (DUF3072)